MFQEGKHIHFCDRSELSLKKNSLSPSALFRQQTEVKKGSAQEKRWEAAADAGHGGDAQTMPPFQDVTVQGSLHPAVWGSRKQALVWFSQSRSEANI